MDYFLVNRFNDNYTYSSQLIYVSVIMCIFRIDCLFQIKIFKNKNCVSWFRVYVKYLLRSSLAKPPSSHHHTDHKNRPGKILRTPFIRPTDRPTHGGGLSAVFAYWIPHRTHILRDRRQSDLCLLVVCAFEIYVQQYIYKRTQMQRRFVCRVQVEVGLHVHLSLL